MGYTVTGPKINISLGINSPSDVFTKEEINNFFYSLVNVEPLTHTVDVSGNAGSQTCDTTIAEQKGYIVIV
jgi:hypothetical protein